MRMLSTLGVPPHRRDSHRQLRNLRPGGEFRNQTSLPTSSQEIAAATVKVLERIRTAATNVRQWPELKGIYHVTGGGETNWYEFAKLILELAGSRGPKLGLPPQREAGH